MLQGAGAGARGLGEKCACGLRAPHGPWWGRSLGGGGGLGARGLLGADAAGRLWFWGLLPVEGLLKGSEDVWSLAEQLLPLRRPGGGLRPALGCRGATGLGDLGPITGLEEA